MKLFSPKYIISLGLIGLLTACYSDRNNMQNGTYAQAGGGGQYEAPAQYNRWKSFIRQIDMSGGRDLGIKTEVVNRDALKLILPEAAAFDSSQSVLKPGIYPILNELATEVNNRAELRVYVTGHADSSGNDRINVPLSQDRANAVSAYLNKRGIVANRISARGFSSSRPIADNGTPAGRKLNRRVEILLYPVNMGDPDQLVR